MWKLQENILSKQDKQLASDFLIKSERLTQFEYVKDFEKNWSTWQGCKFSTYVNSGSSADLIMLDAVKEYNYPVCFNFPAGHIEKNMALYLGKKARLRITKNKVSLEYIK